MPRARRKATTGKRSGSAKRAKASTTKRRTTTPPKTRAAGGRARKVGSSASAARKVGGRGDFGVHAGKPGDRAERLIASEGTKHRDKHLGGPEPRSGAAGTRTSGVGGNASGPGSSSGGDLDTDIVGVGTGGTGISQSGPTGRKRGPDMTRGENTGEPLKVHGDKHESQIPRKRGRGGGGGGKSGATQRGGSFVDHEGDASTTGDGQGAAAATNPTARGDDSFVGEISLGEAAGDDNSPSDRM